MCQGKSDKARRRVCKLCGDEFMSIANHVSYCPTCSPIHKRARSAFANSKLSEQEVAVLVEARALKLLAERMEELANAEERTCPYCGRTFTEPGAYCHECTISGMADVHAITGRTNGWDRAEPPRSDATVDGWRGQPRSGGCTLRARIEY